MNTRSATEKESVHHAEEGVFRTEARRVGFWSRRLGNIAERRYVCCVFITALVSFTIILLTLRVRFCVLLCSLGVL